MKLLHLVRHAQAEHNARLSRSVDPGLTDLGWQQVEQLRKGGVGNVQLVVVSPLRRALQTAVGVFGKAPCCEEESLSPLLLNGIKTSDSDTGCPPFIATELCREFLGVHESNRRSPVSECRLRFPVVDFSLMKDEEDILWDPKIRETKQAVNARAAAFLQWLMNRKETDIAVVSHGGFLSTLIKLPEAEGCPMLVTDKKLSSSFLNCELRTASLMLSNQTRPGPSLVGPSIVC